MKETADKAFSSIDFVGQCLVDSERTLAFKKAIKKSITNKSRAIDLGSGSGILAMFAAKSGAKKVVAVEYDPYVASIAKSNFSINKLNNKIALTVQDARKLDLKKNTKFDVVISEMLTTGIVDEHQVQAMNNLHKKGLVDDKTVFVPQKQETYISLVETVDNLFGQKISMILHLWKWHNWDGLKIKKISNQVLLNTLDFSYQNEEKFSGTVELEILKSGNVTGIYLTSISVFADKKSIGDTEALNAPMFIPLKKNKVTKDQKLKVKVSYIFGGGYGNFSSKFVS